MHTVAEGGGGPNESYSRKFSISSPSWAYNQDLLALFQPNLQQDPQYLVCSADFTEN